MQLLRHLLLATLTLLSVNAAEPALAGKLARVSVTDSDIEDMRRWRELRLWMDEAATQGAAGLILDIHVTQSHAQAALPLAEEIARLKIKTKAFVNTSAIGGGALLALACDEIWMAPGSRIGAAPPKVQVDESLSPKAQDTLLAEALAVLKAGARSLCKLKGHRPEIADAFVDRDKGLVIGTATLAEKGELLLLDADTAVQPVDGKPLLARAIIADVEALAKSATPAGTLVTLNAAWFEKRGEKVAESKPATKAEAKQENKTPVIARDQSYKDKVIVIPVGQDDLIIPARFEFMKRTLNLCNSQGAEAVIFDLDTPGGLAWDTISLMMKDLQNLKTRSFAFVNTRAISAGAMIAMATDVIYMAPASAIGASTPVSGDGTPLAEAERAKNNSAFMGMARTVVREKGHDVRIIEGMIDMDRGLIINGQIIIPKGEIVTLDAEQATMLINGKALLAKGIAKSIDEIKQLESLKGEVITAEPTGFEMIAIWVTRYAAVLILIGLAGGYLEMQTPGFGIPGFISIGAFTLFFFGHYVAGSLAGQETMVVSAIFILGIVLIGVELLAAPGTVLPGLAGFLCVMVALVYAMSGWEMAPPSGEAPPSGDGFSFNYAAYAVGFRNFALGVTGAAVIITLLALWLPELRPFRALVLQTSAGGTLEDTPSMQAAARAKAGDSGTARSALRPYGTIEIDGRLVEAMAEGEYVQSGTAVRVREVRGEKIIVEAV
ncbi:NfeD family protein [Prosthecobacter sp.]|uniref:NfeD family protein n=1 Tax=Prosthecobacter sp. TaxID=1965333 RepID=UPI002AB96A0E|nr:NfeD family protein [Prosthecobacter sp.]MDZ4404864.1 NfeD family protein [Prosthecobacter sp.]